MNPLLSQLQPYPFERLRKLFEGVTPNPAYRPISLGIGEPKHATPPFIQDALAGDLATGLSGYPPTAGTPALRAACEMEPWRPTSCRISSRLSAGPWPSAAAVTSDRAMAPIVARGRCGYTRYSFFE